MFWIKMSANFKTLCIFCMIGVAMPFSSAWTQQKSAGSVSDSLICSQMIELAERAKRIPRGLLEAIARVESGRLVPDQRLSRPWPWTVTARGSGNFYPDKQSARVAIEQFKRDGINNIDVGCMQVNLLYHGNGFSSYEEALDPVNNVAYATELLFSLFQRHRNWDQAVRFYHSSDPEKHNNYLARVVEAWQKVDKPVGLPLKLSPEVKKIEQEREALAVAQKNIEEKARNPNLLAKENDLIVQSKLFADRLRRNLRVQTAPTEQKKQNNGQQYFQNTTNRDLKESGKTPAFYLDRIDSSF